MNKIKRFPSWSVEAKAGLILGFTALTLAGSMTLINNKNNQGTKNSDDPVIVNPSDQPIEVSNNTEIVVNEKIETLVRPYLINATIARHYYDMNDDEVMTLPLLPLLWYTDEDGFVDLEDDEMAWNFKNLVITTTDGDVTAKLAE